MKNSQFNILLFCFFTSFCWGQRLYVETSLSAASFSGFENDSGLNNLTAEPNKPRKIGFGAGVLFPHFRDLLWLDAAVQYNNFKIKTNINNFDTKLPISYDFSFLALKGGVVLKLLNFSSLSARAHGHLSQAWLTRGERLFQNTSTDLAEDSQFHDTLFNYHFGAGVEIAVHPRASVYITQDFRRSFKKTEQEAEAYGIKASTLLIGLLFNLQTRRHRGRYYSY